MALTAELNKRALKLNSNDLPIVKLHDLIPLVGLSKSSIYRLMANSDFPKPIRLSERAVGWLTADIEEWINSRPFSDTTNDDHYLNDKASESNLNTK